MEVTQQDKMKKIIIIGAGGHAAEIDDYISLFNDIQNRNKDKFEIHGFLDDNPDSYKSYQFSAPYLGDIKSHKIDKNCNYIIAIANIKFRRPIIESFLKLEAEFITFIHPSAYISKSANVGTGSVIAPNVNIGPNVKIGRFNMINARASIGHDTIIGDYNFITPNVCFSGFSNIGNENMFGINSATIPNINIGSNNKIAAGMILDKNVKDNTTIFHRFKEKVIAVKS